MGKYITDRKKYETPNPFKNVTPLQGKKPFDDEDVYNLNAKPSSTKVKKGKGRDREGGMRENVTFAGKKHLVIGICTN